MSSHSTVMPLTRCQTLRQLLASETLLRMPCCFDAFSAKLIERAQFPLTFMSGFSVSASRLCLPDTGLISYSEMLDQGRSICTAVDIPVIGDADTGYGNAVNIQRTVDGYCQAGFAGLMIEDQRAPKRCGHTNGKEVISRADALQRMRAVIHAREQLRDRGQDIVIVARTDARATMGLDEALARGLAFAEMGADIVFIEAPRTLEEMQRICREIPGPKMANLIAQGVTPVLPPAQLQEMGFAIAAYPLTLISAAAKAMQDALACLHTEQHPELQLGFGEIQEIVGFPQYDAMLNKLENS